jgi:single-stranded-DNA-specific exonuclease
MDAEDLTIETSEQLKYASPWGQLFPEPTFDDEFKVLNWRIVGEKHLANDNIHIVYRLDVNEFRGKRNLQLIVQHIEAA